MLVDLLTLLKTAILSPTYGFIFYLDGGSVYEPRYYYFIGLVFKFCEKLSNLVDIFLLEKMFSLLIEKFVIF